MNIKRVKWSYLNNRKQRLEYKKWLKDNDEPRVCCIPKCELPKRLERELDRLLFNE